VLEHIDYTVKSADDVVRYLGVPSLGSVPVISVERRSTGGDE
jgi:capsular polysaccharide biosynthesis protein